MGIRYKPDDYIVIENGDKPVYGIVITKGKLLPETNAESDDVESIKFESKQVIANLGKRPKRGTSVFGLTIDPYEFTLDDKNWGQIHFYMDFKNKEGKEDKNLKGFKKALASAYKKLEEANVTQFLPITIRVKQGKKTATSVEAGSYTHTKGGENDHMKIVPIDFTDQNLTEYCLLHESAHGIWYKLVPHDLRMDWLDLYEERNTVIRGDSKLLKRLAKGIAKHEEGFNHYIKNECDENEAELLKEVFKYISRVHSLKQAEVENYIKTRGASDIMKFWPKATDISSRKSDITEYASKSYEEFFAEAVANHLIGNRLPKDVTKLIKKTFKSLIRY